MNETSYRLQQLFKNNSYWHWRLLPKNLSESSTISTTLDLFNNKMFLRSLLFHYVECSPYKSLRLRYYYRNDNVLEGMHSYKPANRTNARTTVRVSTTPSDQSESRTQHNRKKTPVHQRECNFFCLFSWQGKSIGLQWCIALDCYTQNTQNLD